MDKTVEFDVMQEYRNMHSQLETLNGALASIEKYAKSTEKELKEYNGNAKMRKKALDGQEEKIRKALENQDGRIDEALTKTENLIASLRRVYDRLNDISDRLEFAETQLGLREREMTDEEDGIADAITVAERLDKLEESVNAVVKQLKRKNSRKKSGTDTKKPPAKKTDRDKSKEADTVKTEKRNPDTEHKKSEKSEEK